MCCTLIPVLCRAGHPLDGMSETCVHSFPVGVEHRERHLGSGVTLTRRGLVQHCDLCKRFVPRLDIMDLVGHFCQGTGFVIRSLGISHESIGWLVIPLGVSTDSQSNEY
jgi:hypothetical protein